jgi:CheY-like chemotaxis protein
VLALARANTIHMREVEALARETQLAHGRVIDGLELELNKEVHALHRMAQRMLRNDLDHPQWETDAQQHVADFVHLRALEWFDPNFVVRWVVPMEGNEAAQGLDLTMPHMDGEEAFREIRRLRPGVPILLCSGYNEQEVTQRFTGEGLAGFIQKPFSMRELRQQLQRTLQA